MRLAFPCRSYLSISRAERHVAQDCVADATPAASNSRRCGGEAARPSAGAQDESGLFPAETGPRTRRAPVLPPSSGLLLSMARTLLKPYRKGTGTQTWPMTQARRSELRDCPSSAFGSSPDRQLRSDALPAPRALPRSTARQSDLQPERPAPLMIHDRPVPCRRNGPVGKK